MRLALVVALTGWSAAIGAVLGARVVLARRSESAARACHELRGPLTAARLGLELGSRLGELSPDRLRAIGLELECAALALEDLGTGGHGTGRVEEIDVPDLVAGIVEAWSPAAIANRTELVMRLEGEAMSVRGDRLRLAQATANLIANAIEHGRGTVEVRGRPHGSGIRLEVTDEGPGLPAPVAVLARRPRAGRGDRGRGLAIAAAIAADHGGRLAAAPSQRGARLVLDLPAAGPRRSGRPR